MQNLKSSIFWWIAYLFLRCPWLSLGTGCVCVWGGGVPMPVDRYPTLVCVKVTEHEFFWVLAYANSFPVLRTAHSSMCDGLGQWFSDVKVDQNHLEGFLKYRLLRSPLELRIESAWGGAWEFACVTIPQLVLMRFLDYALSRVLFLHITQLCLRDSDLSQQSARPLFSAFWFLHSFLTAAQQLWTLQWEENWKIATKKKKKNYNVFSLGWVNASQGTQSALPTIVGKDWGTALVLFKGHFYGHAGHCWEWNSFFQRTLTLRKCLDLHSWNCPHTSLGSALKSCPSPSSQLIPPLAFLLYIRCRPCHVPSSVPRRTHVASSWKSLVSQLDSFVQVEHPPRARPPA